MLENMHKTMVIHLEKQKAVNEPLHAKRTTSVFGYVRRMNSIARKPIRSIEHAMDIAIGAEPWIEEEAA